MSIGLPQSAAVMIVLTVTALAAAARAQTAGPPLVSPQVEADRRVTFRFRAPSAREVLLAVEGTERRPMSRDDQGVWSLTTPALAPDFYGYTFVADEVGLLDPLNPLMKPNLLNPTSMVHVPGPTSGEGHAPLGCRRRPARTAPPALLPVWGGRRSPRLPRLHAAGLQRTGDGHVSRAVSPARVQ